MSKTSETRNFKAGKLNCLFEQGKLRFIRIGNRDVLNMIYFAVRDQNWATPKQTIQNLSIQTTDDSFTISFDSLCQENGIDFRWKCKIKGECDHLIFDIYGRAHSDFKKNRIGFCVLHPLTCKNTKITITHSNGNITESRFPYHISPHQPFADIAAMTWNAGSLKCLLEFAGDVFETEDQRNWSDASFKTYCTPLDLPFPVQMRQGDEVHQTIRFSIKHDSEYPSFSTHKQYVLDIAGQTSVIPPVGLEANEDTLDDLTKKRLELLHLSHLRVEARTHENNWQQGFEKRLLQAIKLRLQVELIIFLEEDYQQKIALVHQQLKERVTIKSVLPIDTRCKTTSGVFLQRVVPILKNFFSDIPIGGGTDCYFTEFNRGWKPSNLVDFVSFSTNPQVHAFDNTSLIETIQTMPDIVETARLIAGNQPIHISPVTLKPRFNPDATHQTSGGIAGSNSIDYRQMTTFNALWTLGCLKQLIQSGAGLFTFFQTTGQGGILMSHQNTTSNPKEVAINEVFPVFQIFKTLGAFKDGRVIHTTSSHPLQFEGIMLEKDIRKALLLANFTEKELEVAVAKEIYTIMPNDITHVNL